MKVEGRTGEEGDGMRASGVVVSPVRGDGCACGWPRRDVISHACAMCLPTGMQHRQDGRRKVEAANKGLPT
jgi:hypothetical protein